MVKRMNNKILLMISMGLLLSGTVSASEEKSENGMRFEYFSTYKDILDEAETNIEEDKVLDEDQDKLEDPILVQTKSTLHGNYITKIETEIEYNQDDEAVWSKVKYVLGEGTMRPQSWGNWFLFYHFSREEYYEGKPYSKRFKQGDMGNSIMELQPHYVQEKDWGHWGINIGIAHESIADGLFKPRIRPFGSYKLTQNIELFTSWLFTREMFYKKGSPDNNILETDSALIYHFDSGNIALGYFAKFGNKVDDDDVRIYDDGSSPNEFATFSELIWKPRVNYRFDNGFSITFFGEIGKYEEKIDHLESGQTLKKYEEDFTKYGVFMEYPLLDDLTLFGEANYREGEITETHTGPKSADKRDRTHGFAMIGVNYAF